MPLTGGPVLAVKIDNTDRARPRIGLEQADVVYVEPVEGGLTRCWRSSAGTCPPRWGPCAAGVSPTWTSWRTTGRWRWRSPGPRPTRRASSTRASRSTSASTGTRGATGGTTRRPAPYNVIGNTKALLARARGSVKPRDVGFRYGDAAPGGTPATGVTASWPSSTVSLKWNAARKQYLVTTDGRADKSPKGTQYGATTVVVQYVTTRKSGNRDVNGQATPVVTVVGKGRADVLRDGKVWHGSWSRPRVTAPTAFTSAAPGSPSHPPGPCGCCWLHPANG